MVRDVTVAGGPSNERAILLGSEKEMATRIERANAGDRV